MGKTTTKKPKTQIKTDSFSNDPIEEINLNNPYFNSHLITYIGNKRSLLNYLHKGFLKIRKELGKDKLIVMDGFAGSGAVSRLLKAFAEELHVNDFESYTKTINNAYLSNKSEINYKKLEEYIQYLNKYKLASKKPGFIEKNYAPEDDNNIKPGERVFYTRKNARIIDNIRRLIEEKIPSNYQDLCLAPLLVKASIHANTSGVFKGFHKKNGVGHFGGKGEHALSRIKAEIELETPILSNFECPTYVYQKDINELVQNSKLPEFDLVYYDPPYNQHPYGSNYFMLNLINKEGEDHEIQKDGVSGIVKGWKRSDYNKRRKASRAMDKLLSNTNSKYIAISYNNEGIIPMDQFKKILSEHGKWELLQKDYNTYRGSRNLHKRNKKVKELLWILKK